MSGPVPRIRPAVAPGPRSDVPRRSSVTAARSRDAARWRDGSGGPAPRARGGTGTWRLRRTPLTRARATDCIGRAESVALAPQSWSRAHADPTGQLQTRPGRERRRRRALPCLDPSESLHLIRGAGPHRPTGLGCPSRPRSLPPTAGVCAHARGREACTSQARGREVSLFRV